MSGSSLSTRNRERSENTAPETSSDAQGQDVPELPRSKRRRITVAAMLDIEDMLDPRLNPPILSSATSVNLPATIPEEQGAPAALAVPGTLASAALPLALPGPAPPPPPTATKYSKSRRQKPHWAQAPWNDATIPTVVLRHREPPGLPNKSLEEFFVPIWLAARTSVVWRWLLYEQPQSCRVFDDPASATREEHSVAFRECLCQAHNSYLGRRVIVVDDCLPDHLRQVLEICRAAATNTPVALPTPDQATLLTLARIATKCALEPVVNYVAQTVPTLAWKDPLGWFIRCWVRSWLPLLPVCSRLSFSQGAAQDPWTPIASIDDDLADVILARKAYALLVPKYREALSDGLQGLIIGDGGDGYDCTIPALDARRATTSLFKCDHHPDAERLQAQLGDGTIVSVPVALVEVLRDLQQQLVKYPSARTLVAHTGLRDYAGTACSTCCNSLRVHAHHLSSTFSKLLEKRFAHSNVPFPDIQAWIAQQDKGKHIAF